MTKPHSVILTLLFAIACGAPSDPSRDSGATRDGGGRRDGSLPMRDGGARDAASPSTPARQGFGLAACAPLGALPVDAIRVAPDDDLAAIVSAATTGAVIALEDGTYDLPDGGLRFLVPGITLRSVSGDPAAVILDGGWSTAEALRVQANETVIAELTITRAVDHLAHVSPDGAADVDDVSFRRVRFLDGGEQFLKVNSGGGAFDHWTNRGLVECSEFLMTADGRAHTTGCYTGGIDVHGGRDWIVRHNTFEGIWCDSGLAEHAIHFWARSRDTLIENNLMIDNARGIGLGLGSDPSGESRDYADADPSWAALQHVGGLVRNNVIWNVIPRYDTGIEIQRAAEPTVIHNTVLSRASTATGRYSAIDYRYASTRVRIRNNLVDRISVREEAIGTVEGNVDADESSLVDVDGGDFHLAPSAVAAIDTALFDPDSGLDIDGEPHPANLADVGADER